MPPRTAPIKGFFLLVNAPNPAPIAAAPQGLPGRNTLLAIPISVGRRFFRNPASGKPVSGLRVKLPPCDIAKD
jgi:hypothetical protein